MKTILDLLSHASPKDWLIGISGILVAILYIGNKRKQAKIFDLQEEAFDSKLKPLLDENAKHSEASSKAKEEYEKTRNDYDAAVKSDKPWRPGDEG